MAVKRARTKSGRFPKKRRSTRRGYAMARRGGYRRKNKTTIPVAMLAGFAPLVANTANAVRSGGWNGLSAMPKYLIPYDPSTGRMTFQYLGGGLIPIVIGYLVHKVAGMAGINRMLSRANVPLIRL